jgi:hypothetical protein
MSTLADARQREHVLSNPPLLVGKRVRCPRCLGLGDVLEYFVFDRPERYADELNVVMKCRARVHNPHTGRVEVCRCIFSLASDLLSEDEAA